MNLVKNEPPPFWWIIRLVFRSASLEKQIFAFAPYIYSSVHLSEDLLVHEKTHLKQQSYNHLGAIFWWIKYSLSPKFRVKMELEACRAQLKYVKDSGKYSRKLQEDLLKLMSKNLSSEVYNNVITYDEAYERIKNETVRD